MGSARRAVVASKNPDKIREVEAVLENKDIGFVEVGQQAEIKVDTFPFTKYGTIAGEIIGLSNDAIADEQKGLVYKMRVLMEHTERRMS